MDPALEKLLSRGAILVNDDGVASGSVPPDAGHAIPDRLFVVDLEMSGPNPQMHEVLDIGWVIATVSTEIGEESSWGARVKPRHIGNAEIGALKVVGYTPKAWRDAVDLEDAFTRVAEQAGGTAIAGWGIEQDLAFLAESLRRTEQPWPFAPVAIDIQLIARALLAKGTSVDRFNLGHVADRLGIGRMGEHGALPDAYATFDVLVELVKRDGSGSSA